MTRRRLGFTRRFAVSVVKPILTVWTRRTWRGMEHLPRTGGVILVPNHISHADPLVSAHFIYDAGRWPQYLAKASVFRVPVVGAILRRAGQVPVERGSVDAARSLETLVTAVKDGGAVVIYPEGTTSREPDLWPMRGKTGAARVALATGAPVIPIGLWGAQEMFDARTKRFSLRPRIPVTVVAGPPVDLRRWAGAPNTRQVLEEMTEEIMLHVRDLVAEIRGGTPPPLWSPARQNGEARQNGAAPAGQDGAAPAGQDGAAPAGQDGAAPAGQDGDRGTNGELRSGGER